MKDGMRWFPVLNSRWYVLLILTLVYTLNIADRFVLSTLIEPIKSEFALTDAEVGLLTGAVLAVFYVTAGIPLGFLADRINRKRMIVVSLTAWSLLTALCGATRSFMELLLARIGVGIGEAGGTPPSQSLLADRFHPRERAMAMSLFAIGAAAGAALGSSLGGYLNDAYGWRFVLIAFGAMGLPVALILALSVSEPLRGELDASPASQEPANLREALRFIARRPSLLHTLAGVTIITFWGWGLMWWTPSFLARSHAMTLSEIGEHLGLMHALGGTAVTLGTAWAMHRMAGKDPRYQAWFVGGTTLLATAPSMLAYWVSSEAAAIALLWLFIPVTYLYIGPTLALAQNLVPATMRALISAVLVFVANVANLVVAPLLIGFLSDVLSTRIADPAQSLRYVLMACSLTGLWASAHYFAAARRLAHDLARPVDDQRSATQAAAVTGA
ncbi:spinster family MFS transporter [Sphingosinicella sp.]|uniref:spinster family MFS transporter n=1 Tax=Sphingosinicella sp. TaxID=1917971 RepID=UPI0035AF51A2